MNPLELTVTAEQVKSFLDKEFDHWMDDSESPDPTYGIQNYGRHILGLKQQMSWWRGIPFPAPIAQYFEQVKEAAGLFEWSIQAITYPVYSMGRQQKLQQHYESLVAIADLYNQGTSMESSNPDNRELKTVTQELKRQTLIANHLFDPQKRDWEFQRLMWGHPTTLDAFLDSIN